MVIYEITNGHFSRIISPCAAFAPGRPNLVVEQEPSMARRLISMLFALLISMAFVLPSAAQAPATPTPPTIAELEAMVARIETTRQQLNAIWDPWLAQYSDRPLDAEFIYLLPGDPDFSSACLDKEDVEQGARMIASASDTNAYYCKDDGQGRVGAVILPVNALVEFRTGVIWKNSVLPAGGIAALSERDISDLVLFALVMTAHEWGHEVAEELRLTTGQRLPDPPNDELLSDCIAGDYISRIDTNAAAGAGPEMRMLLRAFDAVGDPVAEAANTPAGEATQNYHGTADQRREAFQTGYESLATGSLDELPTSACFTKYWPAVGLPT
jgi:hypothetical protein